MKYTQFMLFALLALMASGCKSSEESGETPEDAGKPENMASAMPDGNQFLFWQIRHSGVEKPSYLFGTIHIIGSEDYFLGENVRDKLVSSDRLVMEVDFDEMDINAMAELGMLPDGKSLRDYLTEDEYELVAATLSDSIGLSRLSFESVYSRMKPLFLEQLVIYKFLGENPISYENEFEFMAEAGGVESDGLESFDDQLRFLDQIPLEDQINDLLHSIENWSETRAQFMKMLDAYKAQDLETLHSIIEEEMDDPRMRELLLERRNEDWVPKLSAFINQGNAFIAVGAGHLAGESGLIILLRAAGYEVWPFPAGDKVESE